MKFIYLFIFVTLFLSGCNNDNNLKAITDAKDYGNTELPKFKFKKKKHDFGTIVEGEKVSHTFEFKNIGKSNLIISQAKTSCGCTVVDYPKKPIKPNEISNITINFDSKNNVGKFNKITIFNANTKLTAVNLYIVGTVISKEKE